MFLQQLITGLSVGSIYALMAVGYSLIYSLLNFTNFAHGASVLIGAYVGYFYISSVADNVLMAVVCSTFFGAVLAALIERIAYQPLLKKGVKRIYLLIAGLGISIIGEFKKASPSLGNINSQEDSTPTNPPCLLCQFLFWAQVSEWSI